MTPLQCKMARAAVSYGVRELAKAAKLAVDTVSRFERGESLKDETVATIKQALERAGAIFIAGNGEGPGVRIRKKRK
jgi:transcriptional regulator with XRE-family HTH domain